MRKLFVLLLFLTFWLNGYSQLVQTTKKFRFAVPYAGDRIYRLKIRSDGVLVSSGTSGRHGILVTDPRNGSTIYYGTFVSLHDTSTLDSIRFISLNTLGSETVLLDIPNSPNKIAIINATSAPGFAAGKNTQIRKLDRQYQVYFDTVQLGFGGALHTQNARFISPNRILLTGYHGSTFFGRFADFFARCIDTNGHEIWNQWYHKGVRNECYHEETTWDGNILLSGYADSYLWAIKIDTLGNKYWEASYLSNTSFQEARIYQHPDGGFVAISYDGPRSGPRYMRLYKFDSQMGLQWQDSVVNTSNPQVYVHDDGSFTTPWSNSQEFLLKRWGANGTTVSTLGLGLASQMTAYFEDILHLPNEEVILGGRILESQGGYSMYLARYSQFGRPFNPLSLARYAQEEPEPIQVFPNPAIDQISIRLPLNTRPGSLQLVNSLGQILALPPASEGQTYSLSHLKPGVYILRAQVGKTWQQAWVVVSR